MKSDDRMNPESVRDVSFKAEFRSPAFSIMADYKEKIDEWQKTVRRKARELDEKFALSDLVGEGSRAAGNAAKRGAETIASGAEKLRSEAERLSSEGDFGDTARRAASEAVRDAEKAGKIIQDAAGYVGGHARMTHIAVFDHGPNHFESSFPLFCRSCR